MLIGGDIRNPKIYEFYQKDDKGKNVSKRVERVGLTDYLINDKVAVEDIIESGNSSDGTPDLIYSGKIVPNPAELLSSDKFPSLLALLKKHYDYIIVDTAPIIAVADTVLISDHADAILYVTRANVTNIDVLNHPINLQKVNLKMFHLLLTVSKNLTLVTVESMAMDMDKRPKNGISLVEVNRTFQWFVNIRIHS